MYEKQPISDGVKLLETHCILLYIIHNYDTFKVCRPVMS